MRAALFLRVGKIWLGSLIGLVVLVLGATPALAAQRYAAPMEAGAKDCSSPASACSLASAMAGAHQGDEVIVEPGSYGTAGTPLSSEISSGAANLNVHGVDSTPGTPSARIFTSATIGVSLYGTGSTIDDLEIVDSASGDGDALRFEGALAERLIVRAGKKEFYACDLQLTATIRDSLCQQEGTGYALETTGVVNGPNHVTARNVTAISKEGVGIYVESAASRPTTMNVFNAIARGGIYDLDAFEGSAEPASITTSHSNYTTTHTSNGATIGDDGTSQTVGDQTEAQLFSEPLGGDFQEALGAQTIGAGLTESANQSPDSNGSLDFYGYPRVFDAGGACASTDIGAGQFVPSAGPTVTGATASAVLQLNATLNGAVNPLGGAGTAHFDYGPAAPGGGLPTSYSSTATQCLPVADTAQPVAASLAGLALGTTYYYRLVARNANATTTPAFTATFTTEGLPCGCVEIIHLLPPELIGVEQSARRWRERNASKEKSGKRKSHKQKLPLGTTFSFHLNQSATVTFEFTEQLGGRKVGRRCVAQTKQNAHRRRCLRTVAAGTLTILAHVGSNKLNFQGVISKHKRLGPGSYRLLITASALGKHSKLSTLHFTIAND
jgi:hypothetical protein